MRAFKFTVRVAQYWRKEIRPLVILALVLFSIRSSLADWNDVPSGSMKPTIIEGDRVFINKLAYDLKVPFTTWHIAQWDNPRRGDIVVFYSPYDGKRLVKRVIGLPGDTIEMRNEQLVINDRAVEYGTDSGRSAWLSQAEASHSIFASEQLEARPHDVMVTPQLAAPRTFGPLQVPEGNYFMMGDNRDNSFDSRFYGPVKRSQIVGRATTVVLSLDHKNYWLPRWRRSLTPLDG